MLKVSCLCPTYNRAPHELHLVEEAVESFLRQDYPNKELIVLNDAPGQTLRFDHPQVRIVNAPFRCVSLGAKRNLLAGLATGELHCPWNDDDVSLPWRLSRSVDMLGEADYYNPRFYWFLDSDGLQHQHALGCAFFASLYRKIAHHAVGGFDEVSMNESTAAHARLRTRRTVEGPRLSLDDWFCICRWDVSRAHLSAQKCIIDWSLPFEESENASWDALGSRPILEGAFTLSPHWEQDYVALTRVYANKARSADPA